MERLQIQLTPEQARVLRRRAHQHGVSVASLVRNAVDASLRASLPPPAPDQLWRRSLAAAGRFEGPAPGNVSEEHDRYLEEIYRS